jgi:hypothetical protein
MAAMGEVRRPMTAPWGERIKSLRQLHVTARIVAALTEAGHSREKILRLFPHLSPEEVADVLDATAQPEQ